MELAKEKEKEAKLEARLRYWDQDTIHQWYWYVQFAFTCCP
jgi:hypothetical protein